MQGQVAELDDGFNRSIELLLNSYDQHMANAAPAPQFLPVTVTITVPSKNLKVPNVHIAPTDTVNEVKGLLRTLMEKRGDPILDFDKDGLFVLVNGQDNISRDEQVILKDENIPILQYQPEPGASLIFEGNIRCKSDAPKQCFKTIFQKDSNVTMDYYTCKDCKFNWICKACADTCHKGHNIVDYIQNHKPTWACCYCVKNGKCALFQKNKQ